MKSLLIYTPLVIILTGIAFWLRFANLDGINLHNDEYYQFETAVSVVETGEYERYNFYTEESEEPYTRAKLYTWQIAKSLEIFGYTETGGRFPAVLWGTLLIPILFLVLMRGTGNGLLAFGVSSLVAFDDFFIEMSRFTRMYSMVFVLTIIIVWLVYELISRKHNQYWNTIIALGVAGTSFVMYSVFPELAMLLWFGISAYVGVRGIHFFFKREPSDVVYGWLTVIGASAALLGGIVHAFIKPFLPLGAFALRIQPEMFYISELFAEMHVPTFGMFFLLLGVMALGSIKRFESFSAVIAFVILVYFIYFGRRWGATRYIGFIIPLVYIVIVLGGLYATKLTTSLLKLSRGSSNVVAVAMLFAFIVIPSFPGVGPLSPLTQVAYADRDYSTINRANVEEAYEYVVNQYQEGDLVLLHVPRYVYWPDNSILVVEMGQFKSLSLEQFVELLDAHDGKVWIVYSNDKQQHLRESVKQYLNRNATQIHELEDTRVNVFYYEQ